MRIFIPLSVGLLVPGLLAASPLEEIKVTAHPLANDGIAQSNKIIGGDELAEKVQGSLGETVAGEVGINSASFGVAVGRPVIHGLGGPRVKTTEDRIDSLDVSVVSTDHAVTVEPFIADRINILKGSSTLLYGSGAIGGVVDIETGRIPSSLPEKVSGRVELRASDNADATVAAGRLDGAVGNFAWHIDAFNRDADDYDIPGFVESAAQRALEEAEEGEEHGHEEGEEHGHEGEEEESGILPGSFSDSSGGAVGFSFIGDSGFVGVSVSTIDSQYGLVGGHGHEEEEEEEHGHEEEEHEHEEEEHGHEEEEEAPGMIDMEQTRIDLEAQYNLSDSLFESINFRVGVNDYEHQEIEGNGEVGTLFDNDAWEARLLLNHQELGGFKGSFGIQADSRDFSAIGEEAFVPPVESDSIGVFWLGEREFDGFDLELGARLEQVEHQPTQGAERDFDAFSLSAGIVWPVTESWTVAALFDYSTRAPSIEELFSNGPHLATQSFEIGDVNLEEESGTSITLTADYRSDVFDLKVTAYHVDFQDYIFQAATGDIEDGFPVFIYDQGDARFTGVDAELAFHVGKFANGDFDILFQYDDVDARLDQGSNRNLPRIPPSRFKVQAVWKNELWQAKLGYANVSAQRDTADLELPTESYDDLSLYLSRSWALDGENVLTLFAHGRNLSDEEQRNHTSFVKDFAPAPGRRIEVGARFSF